MKRYLGWTDREDTLGGPENVVVVVEVTDDFRPTRPRQYPLKHEVHHSPTGFSWGYSGSGPADLARSILADYIGRVPHPVIYQRFKADFIAPLAQGRSWLIDGVEIEAWFQGHKIRNWAQFYQCAKCSWYISEEAARQYDSEGDDDVSALVCECR